MSHSHPHASASGWPPAARACAPRCARGAFRQALRTLLVAGLAASLAACGTPPVKQFEGYSEAFEGVRDATYLLIQDYEQATTAPAPAPAAQSPSQPPEVFDPDAFRRPSSTTMPSDTERRRRAVDAVVRYNEAMLALARGSSLDSVKATLAPLGGLLSLAGPQFNIGATLVTGLLERAAQARDNAEFLRAFREATIPTRDDVACQARPEGEAAMDPGCAPIIEGILEILAQDTVEYYDAQRALMNERLSALGGELVSTADPLFELGERFARPPASSALALRLVGIEDAYFDAARALTPAASRELIVAGEQGATYDETTEKSLQALMVPVDALGQRAAAARQALTDYYAALGRYVALLDRTLELLRETQAAAARPPDLFAIAERLTVLRTDLGRDAIGTREAILRAIAAMQ